MPNSILWIGLVILWVFVLFPLLAARYPRIRRTTDTALATRVLHRGGTSSRAKPGPASGHDSDPDWVPRRVQRKLLHGDDAEDRMTTSADEPVTEDSVTEVVEAEVDEFDETEFAEGSAIDEADIEDAEIETAVEMGAAEGEADAEETGERGSAGAGERDDSETARATTRVHSPQRAPRPSEPEHDEFAEPATEFTEPEALVPESDAAPGRAVPIRRGRGGYDPEADAVARAARYRFRQRTTLGLALSALLFGAAAVAMTPLLWWGCGASVLVLAGYLIYLRRQVRFEEDIRRRRAARLSRGARPAPADTRPSAAPAAEAPSMDRDTARDLRRRAVVLDVDDEDPSFDFLENFDAAAARATRVRAGGTEIRRAAGE